MISFTERMNNLESLLASISNIYTLEVIDDDELDAAITELWDRIDAVKERITVLEDQLAIIQENLSVANG